MGIKISNQIKCVLEPYYDDDITKKLDTAAIFANAEALIAPVYTSATPGNNVIIQDDNGNKITKKQLTEMVLAGCRLVYHKTSDDILDDIWCETLASYNKGLVSSQVFVAQANGKVKAPIPSSTVIYVPQDLKSACKNCLKTNNADELIVNSSFYINEPCVMFYFKNISQFKDYKAYVKNMVGTLSSRMGANVISKFNDFDKMSLNIIEGIILRRNVTDGLEPYSFERLLMKFSLMFMQQMKENALRTGNYECCGVIAPYIDELLVPKNIIFINVEKVAKAPNGKLAREVGNIKAGMKEWFAAISFNKIIKLSEAAIRKRIIGFKIKNHSELMKESAERLEKRNIFRFNKIAMTKYDLSKMITKIIMKEVNVSASENYSKVVKTSYMRASRRNPNNFNLPGKSFSLVYKPDLHIYLDTSGSISEENYKNAILTCITMAKKLNVNLYFNSFSHRISQCCKLNVRGKSIQGIYKEFQKVPKVTGGTSYDIVWDYIMRSAKRRNEISLLITDFAYDPPAKRPDYPSKLYYAPIDVSQGSWPCVSQYAMEFCQNMYHIDPNIRKHLLMK